MDTLFRKGNNECPKMGIDRGQGYILVSSEALNPSATLLHEDPLKILSNEQSVWILFSKIVKSLESIIPKSSVSAGVKQKCANMKCNLEAHKALMQQQTTVANCSTKFIHISVCLLIKIKTRKTTVTCASWRRRYYDFQFIPPSGGEVHFS